MPNLRKPLAESYWVVPDRLLAGRYPGGKSPKEAERRVEAFLEAGFDTFIDLTEAGELPPYDIYLPGSVQYVRKPIPDHGLPRAREHMAEIQAAIDGALSSGRRIYVHCRAGIGRTSLAVACHLIEHGLSANAALIRLNELWRDNERSHTWPDVPETDEQRDYILAWSPRSRSHAGPRCAGCGTHAARAVPGGAGRPGRGRCARRAHAISQTRELRGRRRFTRRRTIRLAAWRVDRRYGHGDAARRKPARTRGFRRARPGAALCALATRRVMAAPPGNASEFPRAWRGLWRPPSTSASPLPARTTPNNSTRTLCRALRRPSCISSPTHRSRWRRQPRRRA